MSETVTPRGKSIQDTMVELQISKATVERLLSLGKLKAVKMGSKTLVTAVSIDEFWNSLPQAKFRAPAKKAA